MFKRKKEFHYSGHASKAYIEKRGWTRSEIENTILDAKKLELSRETEEPHRLAVVYHHPKKPNQYVVRTIDGLLLQVSNLKNKHWKPDKWKENFIYLGKPEERKRRQSHKHKNATKD